jgi:hypothetical protein
MARYRVLQKSFINDAIVEEGEIIEYDGEAGANLELVDAKQAKGGADKEPPAGLLD